MLLLSQLEIADRCQQEDIFSGRTENLRGVWVTLARKPEHIIKDGDQLGGHI